MLKPGYLKWWSVSLPGLALGMLGVMLTTGEGCSSSPRPAGAPVGRATGMNKSQSEARLFVYGAALSSPDEARAWLRRQRSEPAQARQIRLPVWLRLNPSRTAVATAELAMSAGSAEFPVTLDDSGLGISLADRARVAGRGAERCGLWLDGYWRIAGGEGGSRFAVVNVGPILQDNTGTLYAKLALEPGSRPELVAQLERLGDGTRARQEAAGRALVAAGLEALPILISALGDERVYERYDSVNRLNLPPGEVPAPRMAILTVGMRCEDLLYEIITPAAGPGHGGNFKVFSEQILAVDDWPVFWAAHRQMSLEQIHRKLQPLVDAYWDRHGTTQKVTW